MKKRKLRMLRTTCRLAFGWYPKIPKIGMGSVEGIIQHFRWLIAKMILASPLTLPDIARMVDKPVRAVRLGIASKHASIRWLGLIAYVTGNDVKISTRERDAWSGGTTFAASKGT